MAANPNVISIQEDKLSSPTLASSTAHIGADRTWAADFGGQGQAVVILDTGIDADHPFYGGRVDWQACWSNAGGAGSGVTLCPGGGNSQTGPGSADALTAQYMSGGSSICDHGSHVAGIAAGRDPGGAGATGYSGIAPEATIIAIQVFTRFNDNASCDNNPPCVKTYDSDQISAPGCISTAVTVGAVTDPADDVIYNMNEVVDLLAPGASIDSSVPDDTYANHGGTSMAAPHVTGAFAMLKAIKPSMSVDDIETLLETTGVLVTDARPPNPAGDPTGLTKPRIQLDAAVAALTTAYLRLSKDCKPDDPLVARGTGTCTITVENLRPDAAMAVQVVDHYLNSGTFSIGAVVTTKGTCNATPNPKKGQPTVTCDIGGLAAMATATITIPVSASDPQNINDRATVASATPDPDQASNVAEDELNFTAPADLEVFKDCKPDGPLPAGGSGLCTIRVHNWGPATATHVALKDVHMSEPGYFNLIPGSGAVDCSFPGNPVATHGTITCDLGDLAAGAEATVVVGVSTDEELDINDTATATADQADPNTTNNSASDGLKFIAAADLALTKTATPSPAVAGSNLTYDLSVTNNGPSTALNVAISDVLPAGVTIVSVSAPGGTCNAGIPGNAAVPTTCTFDTMVDGVTKTMQVVVKVDPSFLGTLGNNARVSSDTYDPINDNNLATTATLVQGSADLSVEKSDYPDPVLAGSVLTYDVKVTNHGPSSAVDVVLTDVLPAWVTYQGYQVSNGTGTCSLLPGSTDDLSCDLNDLLAGQSVRVVFTVLVNPSTPHGTLISNMATVAAATPDANAANNTATTQTTVNAQADLSITKDASLNVSNPAPRVTYTVVVTNLGPSEAQNVVMVDTLPLDPKKVAHVFDTGNGKCQYNKTTHKVTCNFGMLPANAMASVDIIVDVRGSVRVISNRADVSSTTADANTVNNTAIKEVKIKGGPGKS